MAPWMAAASEAAGLCICFPQALLTLKAEARHKCMQDHQAAIALNAMLTSPPMPAGAAHVQGGGAAAVGGQRHHHAGEWGWGLQRLPAAIAEA